VKHVLVFTRKMSAFLLLKRIKVRSNQNEEELL
jgi:hypothetical protein